MIILHLFLINVKMSDQPRSLTDLEIDDITSNFMLGVKPYIINMLRDIRMKPSKIPELKEQLLQHYNKSLIVVEDPTPRRFELIPETEPTEPIYEGKIKRLGDYPIKHHNYARAMPFEPKPYLPFKPKIYLP
jgi:hypothetical protein